MINVGSIVDERMKRIESDVRKAVQFVKGIDEADVDIFLATVREKLLAHWKKIETPKKGTVLLCLSGAGFVTNDRYVRVPVLRVGKMFIVVQRDRGNGEKFEQKYNRKGGRLAGGRGSGFYGTDRVDEDELAALNKEHA